MSWHRVVVNLRIGIVDDHPSTIVGITAILNAQPDLAVVAAGETVSELISIRTQIDVALLDLTLADGSSPAENILRLRADYIKVLAFVSTESHLVLREAGRAGAVGAIRKSEDPDGVVKAFHDFASKKDLGGKRWRKSLEVASQVTDARLSNREIEVMSHYAGGATADTVANSLMISRDTVNDHIRRIRAKYTAAGRLSANKVDLYRRAVEDGILRPDL